MHDIYDLNTDYRYSVIDMRNILSIRLYKENLDLTSILILTSRPAAIKFIKDSSKKGHLLSKTTYKIVVLNQQKYGLEALVVNFGAIGTTLSIQSLYVGPPSSQKRLLLSDARKLLSSRVTFDEKKIKIFSVDISVVNSEPTAIVCLVDILKGQPVANSTTASQICNFRRNHIMLMEQYFSYLRFGHKQENVSNIETISELMRCSMSTQYRDMMFYFPIEPNTSIGDPIRYAYKSTQEVPFLRQIEHTKLIIARLGGWINLTFLLCTPRKKFVMRLARAGSMRLKQCMGKTFLDEYVNTQAAYRLGFAPKIRYISKSTGTVINDFVENRKTLDKTDFSDEQTLKHATIMLRRIHESNLVFNNEVNIFTEIINLGNYLIARFKKYSPRNLPYLLAIVCEMKSQFDALSIPMVPCHNDANPNNFLLTDDGVQLIDWEFSGYNDPAWDLAYLSSLAEFDFHQDSILLSTYCRSSNALFTARFVRYKALQPLWGSLCLRFLAFNGDDLTDRDSFLKISDTVHEQATILLKEFEHTPIVAQHSEKLLVERSYVVM